MQASDSDAQDVRSILPKEYKIFYGGDQTLRGFGREVLVNHGRGYLTALYVGFELRLVEEIPFGVQPFLLWDLGKFGDQSHTLDAPLFSSEGLGARWSTPFGSLRGSIARGRIFSGDASTADYVQQWVYFFSFGQEF
ncbi:MAG: hypothetical protein EOP06_20945 [Proteobacteria bacterium]|nr:MAG: hypothetical protein EOP06_20945 [Pseudomonadota bacterium]